MDKIYLKFIAALLLSAGLLFAYSRSPHEIEWLPKMHQKFFWEEEKKTSEIKEIEIQKDTDTVRFFPVDRRKQSILLLGDSMAGGLGYRLNDYGQCNDYKVHTVAWDSSTLQAWSNEGRLESFLDMFEPTFVMFSIGSNEQSFPKPELRRPFIEHIISVVDTIPFIWICPPAWKQDKGINDLIKDVVGEERFFDSRRLEFQRRKDHIHPTKESAAQWMDSIAVFLQDSLHTAHPIVLNFPQEKAPQGINITYIHQKN